MARRTLIGMALGNWIGGRPQPNDVAGAALTGYDEKGRPIYQDPDSGEDVTDAVNKAGTGVVKQPSFAMRLFNPEGAATADRYNLEYQTEPARAAQQYRIANAEADDYARHAIAYAKGISPDDVSEQEVEGVRAARGQSIKASGLTPDQYNEMLAAKEELQGGGPQARGRARALQEEGSQREEQTYQDMMGPEKAGMARAAGAQASNEQANTVNTNEPTRRRIQAKELAGEEGRQSTTNAAMDAEAINRLNKATGADRSEIELAQVNASRALGRAADENDVLDYLTRNRKFLEGQVAPIEYGNELNIAKAKSDAAPLVRAGIINSLRQEAAATSQPPANLTATPRLFNPNTDWNPSEGPANAYTPSRAINPFFMPSMMRSYYGGQQLMGQVMGGGGNAMLSPSNPSYPGLVMLPNGGAIRLPPSAPATSGIIQPTNPTDVYSAIAKGLIRSNAIVPQ